MFLAISLTCHCFASEQWFQLMDNQTYVDDFSLASGESREIVVDSDVPIWIGFTSSAGVEEFQKYGSSNPVKLYQAGTGNYVATLMGGSYLFTPENGQIKCVIENKAPESLKFVIYTKEDM